MLLLITQYRCLTLVHKKSRYFWNTQYTTLYWCYCPIQMLNISTHEKRILLERPVYYTILILRSTTYDRRMKTKDRCSAFPPPEFTMFTRGKGKKSLILLSSHAAVSTVGAGVSDPNPLADRIFFTLMVDFKAGNAQKKKGIISSSVLEWFIPYPNVFVWLDPDPFEGNFFFMICYGFGNITYMKGWKKNRFFKAQPRDIVYELV